MMQTNRSAACLAKTRRAWDVLPYPQLVGRQAHTLILVFEELRSLLVGDDVTPIAHELLSEGLLQEQPIEVPAAD